MCGIAGIHRRNGVEAPNLQVLAEELLRGLEMRGRDASGYVTITDEGDARIRKDVVPAHRLVKRMKAEVAKWGIKRPDTVRTMMCHTRFATVGDSRDVKNAHPHVSGKTAIVHNGTIYNDDALFALSGKKRFATVDSEAIAAIVDAFGWDNAKDALELIEGGAAVSMIHGDHPRDLILARVSSFPLVYAVTDEFVIWASTRDVIERAWRAATGKKFKAPIRMLSNGDMVVVHDGEVTESKFRPAKWNRPVIQYTKTATKKAKKQRKAKNRPAGTTTAPATAYLTDDVWDDIDALAELELVGSDLFWDPTKAREQYDDADRDEDILALMSDGFTRREAEQIVDDVLADLRLDDELDDMWEREDVEEAVWVDLDGNVRGVRETKSPAQQAWEALS